MRHPKALSHDELVRFASQVVEALYLEGFIFNPDPEWEAADVLQDVAAVVEKYGLKPDRSTTIDGLVERLVKAEQKFGHDVQLAVDDLVLDNVGTDKRASNINNDGYAHQLPALAEALGMFEMIEAVENLIEVGPNV